MARSFSSLSSRVLIIVALVSMSVALYSLTRAASDCSLTVDQRPSTLALLSAQYAVQPSRDVSSSPRWWWLDGEVELQLIDHVERYQRSLWQRPLGGVEFCVELVLDVPYHSPTDSVLCSDVSAFSRRLRHLLPSSLSAWASLTLRGDIVSECATEEVSDRPCVHTVWLIDGGSPRMRGQKLDQSIDKFFPSYPAPSCRHCSSRLVLVRASDRASLEPVQDRLMDRDVRWSIIVDVDRQLSDGSFYFVLYQIPLPLNEQQFLADLYRVQNQPQPCEEQLFLVRSIGGSGLGSQLHTITRMLRQAVLSGRALLLFRQSQFHYMDDTHCPEQSLECYFHGDLFHQRHRCLDWAQGEWSRNGSLATDPSKDDSNRFWRLFEDYHWLNRDRDFLAERRLNMHGALPGLLLNQPRRWIRQQVDTALSALVASSQSRYIGVHIRHGDKVEEAPLLPFSDYMRAVMDFSRQLAIRHIYVATDNATIFEHELDSYPSLRFQRQEMKRGGQEGDGRWYTAEQDRLTMFIQVMVDIARLRDSQVFIGTQDSGFTVLVQQVRMLHHIDRVSAGIEARTKRLTFVDPSWQDTD